jgi:hypothetical protein
MQNFWFVCDIPVDFFLPISITMNGIMSSMLSFLRVRVLDQFSIVRFLREGNGIDDNLANSRLWTGMHNFWFVCDIPVDFFLSQPSPCWLVPSSNPVLTFFPKKNLQ